MSNYIYLWHNRIIHVVLNQSMYTPINGIPGVIWYGVPDDPPAPVSDILAAQNYSFDSRNGYYQLDTPPGDGWERYADIVRMLKVLERFNGLAATQKLRYTSNSVGQALADVLLVDEIREFRRTNSLDNCTLLTALVQTSEAGLTPEALATKLWLQYESYKAVLAYLYQLEFKIRTLLLEGLYDDATAVLNTELEKMGI